MANFDFNNRTLYHGRPLTETFKIAPMVIEDRKTAISMGMDGEFMETFKSKVHGNRPVLVSFIEVPEEEFDDYMKTSYRDQVNDFFDEYGEKSYKEKYSRCILENGLRCLTRNCCGSCKRRLYPDKPELSEDENPYLKDIREKNCFTSYEELVEDGYEGATVQNEAEIRILYEELLDAAKKVANYYPSVIQYTIEGYNKREIIGKLGLEDNSSNYRKIDKALKFAHDYLTE